MKKDPNEMSFFEHLEELRGRLIKSIGLWLIVFMVCVGFMKDIMNFLAEPFMNSSLSPGTFGMIDIKEPFFSHLKAAFFTSLILSSGIFFYHLWRFVSPGLTKSEKRFALPFISFMALLFMGGCLFSFVQVFPQVVDYLMEWNADGNSNVTRSYYLSMLFAFVLGMGVCFQIPVLIFLLTKIGIVTPRFLMAKSKYAILIVFVIAAIITPTPDVFTQSMFAVPMLGLYFIGVFVSWMFAKPRKKEEDEAEEASEVSKD